MDFVRPYRKRFTAGYFSHTANQLGKVRRIRPPGILRHRLLRLVIGLCPTAALLIFLTIAVSRAGSPSPGLEVPTYLLPGHPLPIAASCEKSDPGFRYILYCTPFQERGSLVHFAYDRRTQVIRSVSRAVDGVTIGDLILAWGTPKSYKYDYGTIQIYWDEKSAWLSAPLDPASSVSLILYHLDASDLPQDQLAWRGFATVENRPGDPHKLSGRRRQS